MIALLLGFSLLVVPFQASESLKVGRIFVRTPYDAAIIFEYANASIPEGLPLKARALECFVSELKATGLFRDMHVEINPVKDGLTLNINITPTWQLGIEKFVIDEIAFEGYEGINVDAIRWYLSQKGLSAGIPLLRSPLLDIQSIIQVAFHEIYSSNPKTVQQFEKLVSKASFRVKVVAPERVKITITPDRRQLCQ